MSESVRKSCMAFEAKQTRNRKKYQISNQEMEKLLHPFPGIVYL